MRRASWWGIVWWVLAVACDGAMASERPYVATRALTAELAHAAVAAAVGSCRQQGYQVAAALVDRSGVLQAFLRDPLAGPHSVDVSRDKAYAAATFQAATLELMDRDMSRLNFAPNVLLIGGGVPIRVAGQFYGAIGVSGAPAEKKTGDIDDRCAQAGIEAVREALEFAE